MKRLFRKNRKIVKEMPGAVALSILIHAALFLLAGMLVVFHGREEGGEEVRAPQGGRAAEDEPRWTRM